MTRRPHVLLAMSMGWAVRNYVRSGLVDRLLVEADVSVLIPVADEEFETELAQRGIRVERLIPYSMPRHVDALHRLLVEAHNRRLGVWHPTFWTWMASLEPVWIRPYLWALRGASALAQGATLYRAGRRLHRWLVHRIPVLEEYRGVFRKLKPDLVVAANPFSMLELPVSLLAEQLDIPCVTAVLSWDNLSYQGFPIAHHTHYIVWSELMKEELLRGEAEVQPEHTTVTGTPQFDFHLDPQLVWTRAEFFRRIGGDPARRLITYSATTAPAFPEEPAVVEILADAIERGEIAGRPQLLLRYHPHDPTPRFQPVLDRHPDILVAQPWKRHPERFRWFTPTNEDLAFLSNTLRHSDANVNPFSTMALDSAIADRPVVCVAFSDRPEAPATKYLMHADGFGHCRYIAESNGARIAYDRAQLVEHINASLEDPVADRAGRSHMVQRICGPVDGEAALRMAEVILNLLGRSGSADLSVARRSDVSSGAGGNERVRAGELRDPVFLVGSGRSGSTVLHGMICEHPNVAWLSAICDRFPHRLWVHRGFMRALEVRPLHRLLLRRLRPAECYDFWETHCVGFRRPFRDLGAADVTNRNREQLRDAVTNLVTPRRFLLVPKLTGWPRIGFLNEIFPRSKFIHLVRDGRAVANSLLNQSWWMGQQGPDNWRFGPLEEEHKEEWERHGRSFVVLAAILWKILMDNVEAGRQSIHPDRFLEVKYESLCRDTSGTYREIVEFCGLGWDSECEDALVGRALESRNPNWKDDLTPGQQEVLELVLRDHLTHYGYR